MAINRKEYTENVDIGLKANKTYSKFLYRCKVKGKTYHLTLDYTKKDWDKKTRKDKAKNEAYKFKSNKLNKYEEEIDPEISLDKFVDIYFSTMQNSTSYSGDKWKKTIKSFYDKYIKKDIGKLKVSQVRQMHIKKIILNIKELNLSARTQKVTIEVLNPIFKSAIANRLIVLNPCNGITVIRPDTKKNVRNASIFLKKVYDAIKSVFKDDMYFQALFLFALQGRRKSEILTLKWKNIDFDNNTYTLENTKNGQEQTFILPDSISSLLLAIKSNKTEYVFESPTNSMGHIQNISGQIKKLKDELNNPSFGIHYLRNVVVSAMAERGIDSVYLSGALGHSDINTVNKYLSIPYTKGSQAANILIDDITKGQGYEN